MRVGVLTGGGDCPGLNAVIRAVVRKGEVRYGDEFVGFLDGWRGVIEDRTMPLDVRGCRGILPRGGTILGTSRTNPYKVDGGPDRCMATLRRAGSTPSWPSAARTRSAWPTGWRARASTSSGVPKTIDNDLSATEVTFGFHTAVQIATDAIDRLHTTAESHDRVIVCEVMGRHAGWIATYAGIAGGAAEILVPEEPFDIDEICANLKARHAQGPLRVDRRGRRRSRPEGGHDRSWRRGELDQFGHARLGGIANAAGRGDREAHRVRDPGDDPRPHPARRDADGVRPGAGDPLRHRGHRRRARRRLRPDGRPAGPARSSGCRCPTRSPSSKTVDPELVAVAELFYT